ncbi:MAG: hypothetical protein HQM08_10615 [Candidatus Riflebacteria bacterium]|nr:hypothetical protein [Candidatus Riflebacteria bacterium]
MFRIKGNNYWNFIKIAILFSFSFSFSPGFSFTYSMKQPSYDAVIRCIFFDSQKNLWIGTFGAGLWEIKEKTPHKALDRFQMQPVVRISKIIEKNGKLIVATAGEGLFSFQPDNKVWSEFQPLAGKDFQFLHGLLDTPEGLMIGSVGSSAAILENDTWKKIGEAQGLDDNWINDFFVFQNETWISGSNGIWKYKNGRIHEYFVPRNEWVHSEVNTATIWQQTLFLGTGEDGLIYRTSDNNFKRFQEIPNSIAALQEFQGNLFVGGKKGLFKISFSLNKKFVTKKIESPLFTSEVYIKSLAVSPDNELFVGTLNGELFKSADGEVFKAVGAFKDGILFLN